MIGNIVGLSRETGECTAAKAWFKQAVCCYEISRQTLGCGRIGSVFAASMDNTLSNASQKVVARAMERGWATSPGHRCWRRYWGLGVGCASAPPGQQV